MRTIGLVYCRSCNHRHKAKQNAIFPESITVWCYTRKAYLVVMRHETTMNLMPV